MPRFSVIVPAYNCDKFLDRCLVSVLSQSFHDLELVVVIDGSPDGSKKVAEARAAMDARVLVVNKEQNGGCHRARKTGVEHISGDYAMFLDSDDELNQGSIAQMMDAFGADPEADVLHFGINVVGVEVSERERSAFEDYINKDVSPLEDGGILSAAYAKSAGYEQDWRLTQRAYRADLLKRAFSRTTDDRLGRNDDGYEYFVVGSLAHRQITRNDIRALDYYYGRGLNGSGAMSGDRFVATSREFKDGVDAAADFAACLPGRVFTDELQGFCEKSTQLLFNDWCERVPDDQKLGAARRAEGVLGAGAVATELMRLARDKAYEVWEGGSSLSGDEPLFDWYRFAVDAAGGDPTEEFQGYHRGLCQTMRDFINRAPDDQKLGAARRAEGVLGAGAVATELMRLARDKAYEVWEGGSSLSGDEPLFDWYRFAVDAAGGDPTAEFAGYYRGMRRILSDCVKKAYEDVRFGISDECARQDIKIFVSTHKDVELFDSKILQPVQVGCALRSNRFDWAFHDDEGENISDLNPMYCELTTQYWAWKNVDAGYYGFCHYRRYFDFSEERHKENDWGEVIDGYISQDAQQRYGLTDESIAKVVVGHDIITSEFKTLSVFPGNTNTPYEHWAAASAANMLHLEDLERLAELIKDMSPEYAEDVDAFLNGPTSCFCNMFIMRKELFFEYCEWLFPILERFVAESDMSCYSKEALRTPGHLSERMLNIWYRHKVRMGTCWKAKQVQCVHFVHPERRRLFNIEVGPKACAALVPVVFAADNNYVPMLTTTIYSMLVNASPAFYYDVVVLEKDILQQSKDRMIGFFADRFPNARIRFCNVCSLIDGYDLSTYNPHISGETYYRFLIQELLPFYSKVLYLDADLIIQDDVSKLYATRLDGNLVAAVKDIDFLAHVNIATEDRMDYALGTLGMKDPYGYFQAGVLLLNTDGLRKLHPLDYWLRLAGDPKLIYNDQDALNACCEGRVLYLDMSWNVMINCVDRVNVIYPYAPSTVYEEFNYARAHERIIHYAGIDKPWIWRDCDRAEEYWRYARETPFYEKLLGRLAFEEATRASAEERARAMGEEPHMPAPAMGENNPLRKVIDPLMPLGSNRREVAKAIGRAIRGRN